MQDEALAKMLQESRQVSKGMCGRGMLSSGCACCGWEVARSGKKTLASEKKRVGAIFFTATTVLKTPPSDPALRRTALTVTLDTRFCAALQCLEETRRENEQIADKLRNFEDLLGRTKQNNDLLSTKLKSFEENLVQEQRDLEEFLTSYKQGAPTGVDPASRSPFQ